MNQPGMNPARQALGHWPLLAGFPRGSRGRLLSQGAPSDAFSPPLLPLYARPCCSGFTHPPFPPVSRLPRRAPLRVTLGPPALLPAVRRPLRKAGVRTWPSQLAPTTSSAGAFTYILPNFLRLPRVPLRVLYRVVFCCVPALSLLCDRPPDLGPRPLGARAPSPSPSRQLLSE